MADLAAFFQSFLPYILNVAAYIVANAPEFVGFAVPVIADFLNKDVKNDHERFIVTVVVCIILSVILKWNVLMGYGNPDQFVELLGIIFLESQAVYRLYFKNSVIRQIIQEKINPSPPDAPTLEVTVNQ